MTKTTLLLAALLLPVQALCLEDTVENRKKEAARYLLATPPRALLNDMVSKMALNLAPDKRDAFKALMIKHFDVDALTKAMTDAMVKYFTADELKGLADFYGSTVGKSAMAKFGAYMTEVMPVVQAEMLKARAKANREQQ